MSLQLADGLVVLLDGENLEVLLRELVGGPLLGVLLLARKLKDFVGGSESDHGVFDGVVQVTYMRRDATPEGCEVADVVGKPVRGKGAKPTEKLLLCFGAVDVGRNGAHGPEGLVPLIGLDELQFGRLGATLEL